MKLVLRLAVVSLVVLAVSAGAWASPTVLTFDDLSGYGQIPSGYGGFTWAANMGFYDSDQWPYNPASPPERVLFNYGSCCSYSESLVTWNGPGSISFLGAYFSGYSTYGSVYFNLYSGNTLVGTSGLLTPTDVPTFLDSGYAGPVTKIGIVGTTGYFVMDNFTYDATPEPGTLVMLGTGALGLAGMLRRKLML